MPRWIALALVSVALVPSLARAHGGPPIFETLSFDPSDAMHVFAGTNFGTIVSHDGGTSWSWVCPSVVGLRTSVEDPLVLVSDMGSLFVGDGGGLWRGSGDACGWSSVLAAPGHVSAGAITRGGPHVLFAGSATDGGTNSVFRSIDDGRTWNSVLGPTINVWYESIAVAPSDPMRVYAVQNLPPQRAEPWVVTVFRSIDGGTTWTSAAPLPLLAHEWRLYLLGVDPANPDRILGYVQNLFAGDHERVMLSEDGGVSWTDVLHLTQVLGGGWEPDGSSAYVAGPVDGLWRSDDHGHGFMGIRTDLYLRCVVADGHALWVCADDFTAHFSVGRSIDRGMTFQPIARLRSIEGMPMCAASSELAMTCPAEQSVLDSALAAAPGPDGGATPDAGARVDAAIVPAASARCGCSAGRSDPPLAIAIAMFLALGVRAGGARQSRHRPGASAIA